MPKRNKKKIVRIIVIITSIGLIVLASLLFYKWLMYEKAKFTRYPEFNIYIPDGYTIHGIDVSKHQSIIAWEEVKKMDVSGIRLGFAFIKASEGIGNVEDYYSVQWAFSWYRQFKIQSCSYSRHHPDQAIRNCI